MHHLPLCLTRALMHRNVLISAQRFFTAFTYDYDHDPGEGREKHRWGKPYAGFKPGSKGPVGKCSSLIDEERARELLNDGIALPDNAGGNHPRKIVNQFEGAIYLAVPTEPGKSYHGYPWRDDQQSPRVSSVPGKGLARDP